MKKNRIWVITLVFLIVLNLLFFVIGYVNFLYPKLGSFEIQQVAEKDGLLCVFTSKSHNAVRYKVDIYKDKELIYETESEDDVIPLPNFEAQYLDLLTVKVTAFNKNGVQMQKEYLYRYEDANFQKDKDHLLSLSRDLSLHIDGLQEKSKIELYYEQHKLYEEEIETDEVVIPYDVVLGYSGRITALLKNENGRRISSFNFYLNTPLVGKISLENPISETRWNDIEISYSGGENANHFYAYLYSNEMLLKQIELEPFDGKFLIPATNLQEDTLYHIMIEAVYEDYTEIAERASFDVHIGKKETTNAVYVSHNPTFISPNTSVTLNSITEDAEIYYTLDGSDPNYGMLYEKPIVITENTTLRTIAKSKNRYDSNMNTYSFQIGEKTPVIYLSPSNQNENYGVSKVGYTNEMDIMNRIAQSLQEKLTNHGFIVYRNNPRTGINEWVQESLYYQADFHFAIHSNASSHHTARGPEIHIDNPSSLSFSIASNLYENLWKIYDGNTNYEYHRGIKFTNGELGEASDRYLPCSTLIEVAFHDEENDASWVMNHIEDISESFAQSIVAYYG